VRISLRIKRLLGWSPVRYASRILVAQISQSLRLQAVSLVSQALGVVTIVSYFHKALNLYVLIGWVVFALAAIWSGVVFRRRFRDDTSRQSNVRKWLRAWMLVAVFSGLVWGFAGSVFLFPTQSMDEVVLVSVIVAIVFASWPVFSCWLPGLSTFTLLALTPMFFGLASAYGIGQLLTLVILVVITSFVLYSGRRLNEIVVLSVIRNAQNERLVTRLKAQTALADSARKATAAASELREQFFAGANHDLRQPLQALGIYLQLMKNTAQPHQREALEQVEACATNISTLVEQLLEVSRIESGHFNVTMERIALPELFSEIEVEFSALCADRGLRFDAKPSDCSIECDRTLLLRVLRNLLSNAVRYTRSLVRLEARLGSQGCVSLCVVDDGPGIAEQEKGRIFDAFYRGEAGKAASQGYGLGLSIVKGIASRLSVPLSIEATAGGGATFRLDFLAHPLVEQPQKHSELLLGDAALRIDGLVGLLEDNAIVREAIATMLSSFGAEVLSSASPETGFVERLIAEAQAGHLAAIVSDFNLGEGFPNGLETIYLVTSTAQTPIKAILLTAVNAESVREAYEALRSRERGAKDFPMPLLLQKPATAKALFDALAVGSTAVA